jgi:NAD(P)-dependent dehydrogenase (short-subunit alcohol dehydrogenase family)
MTTTSQSPVVLITGALAGIGRATAFAFARNGARVIVSGRKEEAGRQLAGELEAVGAEAGFVRADVRFEDDVRDLVDHAVARFGRLDIAINNAGVEGTPGPLTEQTPVSYAAVFETNVLGVMLSLKHELRVMIPQGSGSIVNVSSLLGHKGYANVAVYAASKHAVEGLSKSAALEAAPAGVRVNTIAPGPIETDMLNRFVPNAEAKAAFAANVPLHRIGQAGEIARAIVFLASSDASFVTGVSLNADGGMSA